MLVVMQAHATEEQVRAIMRTQATRTQRLAVADDIIDNDGYYAATEGGEYPLGDFHVTLAGSTVPRENNSVVLVLDRSGSMADPAGGTSTKSSLLKNAVSVFNSLMLANGPRSLADNNLNPPAVQTANGDSNTQGKFYNLATADNSLISDLGREELELLLS